MTDFVAEEAKIAANTTRATPIISAADVVAVRLGLRSVFSRASRPVTPRSASIGRPASSPQKESGVPCAPQRATMVRRKARKLVESMS